MTLEWMLEKAADAVMRHGIQVLVIDPWNEVEHARPKHELETQYDNRSLRQIRRFALKHEVLAIVLAHSTKDVGKGGEARTPTLYDIEGSAAWYNKPDHGIVIDVPEPDLKETVVWIRKARFSWSGRKGEVTLEYLPETEGYRSLCGIAPRWPVATNRGREQMNCSRFTHQGVGLTSNNSERLPYGRSHKCTPGFASRHLVLHCQLAELPGVLLKPAEFHDCMPAQDCKRLKRATDLENRSFRHLYDHRSPFDFGGRGDFIRVHRLSPNQHEILTQQQRDAEGFVPQLELALRHDQKPKIFLPLEANSTYGMGQ